MAFQDGVGWRGGGLQASMRIGPQRSGDVRCLFLSEEALRPQLLPSYSLRNRASSRPCDMNYSEATLADAVVSRLDCNDERFKSVMTSLIRSLHAFVREVEPTEEEWLKRGQLIPPLVARAECHAPTGWPPFAS